MSMTNDLCERAPLRAAAKQIALSVAAKQPAFSGFYSKKRWRITIRSVRAGSLARRFRKKPEKTSENHISGREKLLFWVAISRTQNRITRELHGADCPDEALERGNRA